MNLPWQYPSSCNTPIPSTVSSETTGARATEWKGVASLTTEAARAFRDRVAIVDSSGAINGNANDSGELRITYGELNLRADRLAAELRAIGLGAEDVVALRFPRSVGLIVGVLGVLKAGAAYLPLNPRTPAPRINFELDDSGARAIVTSAGSNAGFDPRGRSLVFLDETGRIASPSSPPDAGLNHGGAVNAPENLAYIIYTSGSTGKPKGVEVTHANLLNLVRWHRQAFDLASNDRMSLLASVEFDASVWEMWPALCIGASLYVPDDLTTQDPEALRDWLIDRAITISFAPTPMAERLMALPWPHLVPLRILLTGGDTLHVRPRSSLPFRVVNNYGPTESTVVATSGPVTPEESADGLPTIGRPIANATIHILDEQLRPANQGEEGEICIGGAGVARGYRNQPKLTHSKFVPDRFSDDMDARLYRTGDLGRLLPNGELAFLGRIDNQVKIRGFRIELDAIASVLDEHPTVKQSAVVARDYEAGDKRLVAYVVGDIGAPMTHSSLRDHLAARLPSHMIPAVFVSMDALPVNSNGKIDRNSLPEPNDSNRLASTPYVAPRTATQQRVTELVAPLLGIERVSVEDNFFMLGGHSLLGTQLIARIRAAFGVELSLRSLFECPTIAALASEVDRLILASVARPGEQASSNLALEG
ncbi:MAG TPA: non-ribosomal peptide synthetase [Candidatus Acidoferrum sp.]|nr:non-ribosomal peptide synthetase [Candidatus Acidoferrum sp.]